MNTQPDGITELRCDNPRCNHVTVDEDRSTWLDVVDVDFIDLDREICMQFCRHCLDNLSRTAKVVDGKPFIFTEVELAARRAAKRP